MYILQTDLNDNMVHHGSLRVNLPGVQCEQPKSFHGIALTFTKTKVELFIVCLFVALKQTQDAHATYDNQTSPISCVCAMWMQSTS